MGLIDVFLSKTEVEPNKYMNSAAANTPKVMELLANSKGNTILHFSDEWVYGTIECAEVLS